ncbi:MAG: NADH-quinone oxidoreductase subunit A [Elusimicrobia bacterium]|nr:NADH-quinone oxidoreductase subunit A [Elusimicrobiota bacterium]
MLSQYFHVFLFLAIGLVFGVMLLFISSLVRARSQEKDSSAYECGMQAIGSPWVSPNIRFYIFALLFVVFDAEALFIFPWAVRFRELGLIGYVEVLVFVGILFFGLIYAWKKGALKWE